MYKKKVILSTMILLLTLPLTAFTILDETGVFDRRSRAQSTLLEEFLPADLVGNNSVGVEDFEIWLEEYRAYKADSANYSERSDLNASGDINLSDFSTWLGKWRDFRRYKANPEAYMENVPGGLVAHWTLDEHTGSGSFLKDEASRRYGAEPLDSEIYSTGVFGAARVLKEGDGIKVQNGSELPIGESDSVASFWVNLLDSNFFELGNNSSLLVWENGTEAFNLIPGGDLGFDLEPFFSQFTEIDIEGNLADGSQGWFHWMAIFNSEENIMEYFINGNSVASYGNSVVGDVSMLMPVPKDRDIAIDNVQVWDITYAKKVYENSTYNPAGTVAGSCPNRPNSPPEVDVEPYYTSPFSSPTQQEEPERRDPNISYNTLGYESRDCVICSTDFKAAVAHFNILGYEKSSAPSDLVCQQALAGQLGYSAESGSLFYTCASRFVRCGYLSPDFKITSYPVGNDSAVGLNTRAEYLECVNYIIFNQDPDNWTVSINNLPRKSCTACSTNYSYVAAYWNGTCEETTDEERISVDPEFRYKCSRCGGCTNAGKPNEHDEIFAKYYVNHDPNRMSAYDSYEENCVADREGCPTLLFKPTSEGCHRCSNSYKYTYAKWDNPGTDGECFTEDDLYDKATYTCNCSCTANGSLTSEGQWVDSSSGRTSYSDCVKYCDSLK